MHHVHANIYFITPKEIILLLKYAQPFKPLQCMGQKHKVYSFYILGSKLTVNDEVLAIFLLNVLPVNIFASSPTSHSTLSDSHLLSFRKLAVS